MGIGVARFDIDDGAIPEIATREADAALQLQLWQRPRTVALIALCAAAAASFAVWTPGSDPGRSL